ncbi:GtrA family protein [Sphingomonas sp. ABOLE]|uniref:GtrA family protein n=1 Tax=Sphingomonas sp. ABOLE TaxID=1985878 RepID=UPI000F7E3649|nr:GtrA family protein [Sphingomonas sp. ABOLE]RSV42512.1 GtrA family protein [Sphingomonas sp. ABOLE]
MALSRARLLELWRYYQMGVLNTAFGLGMYSLLVWLGMNMFLAQLTAHLLGMAFNYFTYSRHVFRDAGPAKVRFALSYGVNYVIGLAMLAAVSRVVASPYIAGLAAAVLVSIINYFLLSRMVFKKAAA